MQKDIEILAKRKIAKEDARISREIQSEVSAAKSDLSRRGFNLADGPSVTKLHRITRRNVKLKAQAAYEAYKQAFSVAGVPLTEAVLRECARQAAPYYDNAAKNIAGFVRNQCRGSGDIDPLFESLKHEVERDQHDFLNQIEIESTEARLKVKAGIPGELLSLRQLPNADALNADLTRFLNGEHPTSVLFIDLDGFKALNDHQGHDAGDDCLEDVVRIIGNAILGKGRVYRRGGDEFVAVLHNTTLAEAALTAERIRSGIDIAEVGAADKITCSIGVASSETTALDSAESLLKAADKAMYGSKYTTKNRVVKWPLETEIAKAVEEGRKKVENQR